MRAYPVWVVFPLASAPLAFSGYVVGEVLWSILFIAVTVWGKIR